MKSYDVIDYIFSHFKSNLPAHAKKFVRQSIKPESPGTFVLLSILDGRYARHTTQQSNLSLQVLVQHETDEEARELANEMYDFFAEAYDLILAPPVGKSGLKSLTISAAIPQAIPQPLGDVGNGRYRYSTNYQLVVGDPLS